MPEAGPTQLADVLAAEYQALRPGCDFASRDSTELFAKLNACPQPLTALCISGGGIRSATFALGAIQGLARHGLLDKFDYLSTVSGGGFIGSWLTAWSRRAGGLSNILGQLQPDARPAELSAALPPDQTDPIAHLRDYNSYMSPRLGLLSADTWTLIATVVRNLLLNWMVLLPMLMAALLLPRLVLSLLALPEWYFGALIFAKNPPDYGNRALNVFSDALGVHYGLPLMGACLFALAMFNTLRFLPGMGNTDHSRRDFALQILLPLIGTVLAYVAFDSLYYVGSGYEFQNSLGGQLLAVLLPTALAWLAYRLTARRTAVARNMLSPLALAIFVMAAGTGIAIWLAANFLLWSPNPLSDLSWPAYVTVAPPAILLGYVMGTVLFVGLSSAALKDEDREWMSRGMAGMLMFCVAWLAGCGAVLIAPRWVVNWHSWASEAWIALTAVSAWLSAFGPALLAQRAPAGGAGNGKAWSAAALVVQLAPLVFVIALVIGLSLATNALLLALHLLPAIGQWPPLQLLAVDGSAIAWSAHYPVLGRSHPYALLLLMALLLLLSQVMARFVNINTFSLHAMYRDRLVRAYIGASNPRRAANRFTGFARGDDCAMHDLDATHKPLQVVNLTLNLVQSNRLAWQQRKAQPFTVTALHCGNFELGYRPSAQYGGRDGITLGSAVAISGAAASPSMGSYSSSAAGFIMTLLNTRLGCWLGNPGVAGNRSWQHAGPRSPVASLLQEAFGLTSNQTPYVYLSDGGHFENLGLFEMVLRRCRCIVVIDSECDPGLDLAGLGNALRKIRIDLGIDIAFDAPAMQALRARKQRCAVASIGYSSVDADAADGQLIYIKPMLCGNEPPDVENYGSTHPEFPHEGTGKQWFDESQTESYRMLGLQTIDELCGNWQGDSLQDLCRHAGQPAPAGVAQGQGAKTKISSLHEKPTDSRKVIA